MVDSEGHPDGDEITLGSVLSALADPLRRQVVAELARAPIGAERTCASFGFPVSKATLTHHFRVLREAGLIRTECAGTTHMNQLRRAELDARFPGLMGAILGQRALAEAAAG